MEQVMAWINGGAIGTLRKFITGQTARYGHNILNYQKINLRFRKDLTGISGLGPEAYRDYSPDYTNMVFRGWYDFGGGSMADMGHYSLWTVFNALN